MTVSHAHIWVFPGPDGAGDKMDFAANAAKISTALTEVKQAARPIPAAELAGRWASGLFYYVIRGPEITTPLVRREISRSTHPLSRTPI